MLEASRVDCILNVNSLVEGQIKTLTSVSKQFPVLM